MASVDFRIARHLLNQIEEVEVIEDAEALAGPRGAFESSVSFLLLSQRKMVVFCG
jgi:hypothetical protein